MNSFRFYHEAPGGALLRGFSEIECATYFPDGDCPTLEEILAGD